MYLFQMNVRSNSRIPSHHRYMKPSDPSTAGQTGVAFAVASLVPFDLASSTASDQLLNTTMPTSTTPTARIHFRPQPGLRGAAQPATTTIRPINPMATRPRTTSSVSEARAPAVALPTNVAASLSTSNDNEPRKSIHNAVGSRETLDLVSRGRRA